MRLANHEGLKNVEGKQNEVKLEFPYFDFGLCVSHDKPPYCTN